MSKRLTGQELLDAWKAKEEQIRLEKEKARKKALESVPNQCKNCANSWYRLVPPTGSFTEATEYCGCKIKIKLVDPCDVCELFTP